MTTQSQAALTYWDRVLLAKYELRIVFLGQKSKELEAAGFTGGQQMVMLSRGWGGQFTDPHLSEERAAEMALFVLGDTSEFISFQA